MNQKVFLIITNGTFFHCSTFDDNRIKLTATTPLFLLAVVFSSADCGEYTVFDKGVIGFGDNTGPQLFWVLFVCWIVVCSAVGAVIFASRSYEFKIFHSGASDTSVVTSLEKNSSIVCRINHNN